MSANEMQELYGVPAAQALGHVRSLLAQRNVWTDLEKEQLLLVDLENLKNQVSTRVYKGDVESEGMLLKVLNQIGKIIESRKALNGKEIEKFAQAQAKATIGFLEEAFSSAVHELERLHPEVDTKLLTLEFENQLRYAIL